MRKNLSLILSMLLIFTLTSCGKSKSEGVMAVTDGTFGLTPQDYVDRLNSYVEDQNDSRYLSIPEYVESGRPILVDSIYLCLVLTANEEGKLTEIKWEWHAEEEGTTDNLNLFLNATIYMISADKEAIETVIDGLDAMDTEYHHYETSCSVDGALYQYASTGYAKYNSITIIPDIDG